MGAPRRRARAADLAAVDQQPRPDLARRLVRACGSPVDRHRADVLRSRPDGVAMAGAARARPGGDARPSLRRVMRIFFVSTFVGTFLPASVGGDLVRAYALSSERVPIAISVASVVMDRALGVMSILLLGVVSVSVAPDRAPPGRRTHPVAGRADVRGARHRGVQRAGGTTARRDCGTAAVGRTAADRGPAARSRA